MLVDIALLLRELRPAADFRFVIAGDGPELASLKRKVERSGLASVFDFLGQVEDLQPILAESDLLILTSEAREFLLSFWKRLRAENP